MLVIFFARQGAPAVPSGDPWALVRERGTGNRQRRLETSQSGPLTTIKHFKATYKANISAFRFGNCRAGKVVLARRAVRERTGKAPIVARSALPCWLSQC